MRTQYFILNILFCSAIFFLSCKNKDRQSEHQAANPFDTTQTAAQNLTEDDRTKLRQAQGKKAIITSNALLADKIAASSRRLFIYYFWQMGDQTQINAAKAVNDLAAQYDSSRLKVVFVLVSPNASLDSLNLMIRENQLTEDTYILDRLDKAIFANKVKKDFATAEQLPLLLVINKAEGLIFFYNKALDDLELKAVIQPLVQ